jgi:hypothetical protein
VNEVSKVNEVNERPPATRIAAVRAQSRVTVTGVIRSVATLAIGPSPAVRCVLADGSGQLDLLFLGVPSVTGLAPGRRCTATGRACLYRGRLVTWNPRYQLDPPATPPGAPPRNGHARDFPTRPLPARDLQLNAPHAARPSGEGR